MASNAQNARGTVRQHPILGTSHSNFPYRRQTNTLPSTLPLYCSHARAHLAGESHLRRM